MNLRKVFVALTTRPVNLYYNPVTGKSIEAGLLLVPAKKDYHVGMIIPVLESTFSKAMFEYMGYAVDGLVKSNSFIRFDTTSQRGKLLLSIVEL